MISSPIYVRLSPRVSMKFPGLSSWFSEPSPAPQKAAVSRSFEELRTAVRKRMRLYEGFICASDTLVPKACHIRDLSAFGAQLQLCEGTAGGAMSAGCMITLYLCPEDSEVDAEVRWTKGNRLGVHFIGRNRRPTRRYR